jgi:hypothetical protein
MVHYSSDLSPWLAHSRSFTTTMDRQRVTPAAAALSNGLHES